jgi:hypothetical protein
MRWAYWLIVITAVGLLAAGCSTTSYDYGERTFVPAHTDRYFAPMSLPAFAADGSMYVANGDTLLHFSAGGARLGSSALPVDLDVYQPQNSSMPRGYATPSGDVYIVLDHERIGLLGPTQQLTWTKTWDNRMSEPVPFEHGLLLEHEVDRRTEVSFIDSSGAVQWSVPGDELFWDPVQVDEQNRVYFCKRTSLIALSESGTELRHIDFPEVEHSVRLLHVRSGCILVRADDGVTCFGLNGTALWALAPPFDQGYFSDGLVLSADRFVLQVESHTTPFTQLLIVDGQGRIIHKLTSYFNWRLRNSNGPEFIAQLDYSADNAWGLFNAEGEQLWNKQLPQQLAPEYTLIGENLYAWYPYGIGPVFGADGRIYYTVDNTLYAVDLQGNPLWQATGAVCHDEWYPDTYYSSAF